MSASQPAAEQPPWINHYHVLLPNASNSAILMVPGAGKWQLPYARGEGLWFTESARIQPLLRDALQGDFDFTILRFINHKEDGAQRSTYGICVLEPSQPLEQPPLGGQWINRDTLHELAMTHPDQRADLLRYLEEQDETGAAQIDARRSPWARPGWFAAASAWIGEAIREQGYEQTGKVEQVRNWSISSVLVAPTSAGRVFFKAAAALPLFVDEPALTQTLSELFEGKVPKPLQVDHERHWMLMADIAPVPWQDEGLDLAPILAEFGKLQRESSNHFDKLRAAGCHDRRLEVLAGQIDELMADPITESALNAEEFAELVALAPQLKERCAKVAAYHIPPALLHGDLNLGNMSQHGEGFIFFDWTDAAISFPFLDHFLLYFPDEESADIVRWRDAYLEAWHGDESPERLVEAWELAKSLCGLHHTISYLSIAKNLEPLARGELFHGLPDNLRRILSAMRAA